MISWLIVPLSCGDKRWLWLVYNETRRVAALQRCRNPFSKGICLVGKINHRVEHDSCGAGRFSKFWNIPVGIAGIPFSFLERLAFAFSVITDL
jgi:hypothetical protein